MHVLGKNISKERRFGNVRQMQMGQNLVYFGEMVNTVLGFQSP